MKDMKLAEIISKNRALGAQLKSESINISCLSNISINSIKDLFEYSLRSKDINASVKLGDFDNIVQDSEKFASSDAVVIFWEPSNIVEGFQYKANLMSTGELQNLAEKVKMELSLCFKNLKSTRLVLINSFSSIAFDHAYLKKTKFESFCDDINQFLEKNLPNNFVLIPLEKVLVRVGLASAFDWRFFYSSKTLYSVNFLKDYTAFVLPVVSTALGKTKKVLVLDCDNTMWGGVLGEDGEDGLKIGEGAEGAIFEEVQSLAKNLVKEGVILALCSKNNLSDVQGYLERTKVCPIKTDDISIMQINWDDKAKNLKIIAEKLNLGLDSVIFVDDSDFEINLVNQLLPMVDTIQVPANRNTYANVFREMMRSFYSFSQTSEDLQKTQMYKAETSRSESKDNFQDLNEYLAFLNLKVSINKNDLDKVERISQLTQKTNQFNLTTKRYATNEILDFMNSSNYAVYSFSVKDKYGDYGLVGVVITEKVDSKVNIDSFLMSCRAMGRNVEFAFFDNLISILKNYGVSEITGEYIATPKNIPVADFYKTLGFESINENYYNLKIENHRPMNMDYINVSIL